MEYVIVDISDVEFVGVVPTQMTAVPMELQALEVQFF